jgi:hypothetical protein
LETATALDEISTIAGSLAAIFRLLEAGVAGIEDRPGEEQRGRKADGL